jgi:hypothetical protein
VLVEHTAGLNLATDRRLVLGRHRVKGRPTDGDANQFYRGSP